jgi:RNA polymerase sigma factor (sigma-70 family)
VTQWDQVKLTQNPVAYVRRAMVNQAAKRYRRADRERRGLERLQNVVPSVTFDPDGDDVVDVRSVLEGLPPRRRACLVLRFAFDLSEREVAVTLGISVGTVKSQTSKAVRQFREAFGGPSSTPSSESGATGLTDATNGTGRSSGVRPRSSGATRWEKRSHAL